MQDVLKRVVPWNITDDKALVCYNGSLTPLCCVLHKMSSDHGLVDVQILDHKQSPKMRAAIWLTFTYHYVIGYFEICLTQILYRLIR